MIIVKLTRASKEAVKDISALLTQLRENPKEYKASLVDLKNITADKNTVLIVAKDGRKIVGMAALYILQKFSKRTAHVEDVVVDSAYRGQGLGEKIMQAVISAARAKKVLTLHLTSRPARVAAHKLYHKVGFQIKDTTVFKMKL